MHGHAASWLLVKECFKFPSVLVPILVAEAAIAVPEYSGFIVQKLLVGESINWSCVAIVPICAKSLSLPL